MAQGAEGAGGRVVEGDGADAGHAVPDPRPRHTIGIKLFAEGVVVIGLAEVDAPGGVSTPGAATGTAALPAKSQRSMVPKTPRSVLAYSFPMSLVRVCHRDCPGAGGIGGAEPADSGDGPGAD